jgi:hypothetical protein
VTSALGPAVVALFGGAFVAQVFGGIFRGCISASVVCFLADREMFMENQGFSDNEISAYFYEKQKSNNLSISKEADGQIV